MLILETESDLFYKKQVFELWPSAGCSTICEQKRSSKTPGSKRVWDGLGLWAFAGVSLSEGA